MSKQIQLIILTLLLSTNSYSQVFQNRLTIYISAAENIMAGPEYDRANGLVLPGLYTNFRNGRSLILDGSYRVNQNLYACAEFGIGKFEDWSLPNETLFEDSKINTTSLSAGIKFINPFSDEKSKISFFYYAQIDLAFEFRTINISNLIIVEQEGISIPVEPANFKYLNPGVSISSGLAYWPQDIVGFFIELGGTVYLSDSSLTNENTINIISFKTGVAIRFLRNKHYYY